MSPQEEQRRYPRHAIAERASILLGPTTFIFSETVDISRGGVCLKLPSRFTMAAGEPVHLSSAHIGAQRPARVVGVSPRGLHCAFDDPVAVASFA